MKHYQMNIAANSTSVPATLGTEGKPRFLLIL